MSRYDTIKKFYLKGLYSNEQIATFVNCGWITQSQADEIKMEEQNGENN